MNGGTTQPDISVALLTRNGGATLSRLLEALPGQNTARRVEVVAVDSSSSDNTQEVLRRAGARVETILAEDFDFGETRDRVFSMARAPIIISLSQDAVPAHADWLERLVAPLDNTGAAASCGRSIPDPTQKTRQFMWEKNGLFYFTREIGKFTTRYGRGLSNANAAYRRDIWERLRFGPQPIGEDFRYQIKLMEGGYDIAFVHGAEVYHHHDYSVTELAKRARNEGFGLRQLGCPYTEADMLCDLFNRRVYIAWLRGLATGRMRRSAEFVFPWLRPLAVYTGSRFGQRYRP